jgi:UDP-2-acetamido-2,6-beta-L-arabino-hexul-4-ose reductase
MITVGITGQSGFVGTHLFNTLGLYPSKYKLIPFEDSYFSDNNTLAQFVSSCDVVIHLAALNRHNDAEIIYKTNIYLVRQMIDACESTNSKPYILFSSSTQEESDNEYGKSKKESRYLFEKWADRNKSRFSGLVIPNVFGPFGKPYYNSVVATFCYKLSHNEQPKIEKNADIKLIYVGELVQQIIDQVDKYKLENGRETGVDLIKIPYTHQTNISDLLELLTNYKNLYFEKGEIPSLANQFERNLFNTFLTYIDHSAFFPFSLSKNEDKRGGFVEILKINSGGQVSFSTTFKTITRGNHYHTRKAERFVVIKGKAKIELRRIGTDKVISFNLDGSQPSFVDMPIWFTHNITNIGEEDLYTIFWISEKFNSMDPDTYFEKV